MISDAIRFLPRKSINDVNRCVRKIVAHAYKNVPFYRNLYDRAGIHPSSIKGIDDLPKLPVISRLELMEEGIDSYLRQGADLKKLSVKHTTGTTGHPVMVYLNLCEYVFRVMIMFDLYARNSSLTFPLTIVDVGPERKDSATKMYQRVGPMKIIRLFRDLPLEQQADILKRANPTIINGRPSVLWQLANVFQDKNIIPPNPKIINSGGEMLFKHVRQLLQEVFRCGVADNYNSEEIGNIAWQCPSDVHKMHPNMAASWLESLNHKGMPAPNGTEGRLVVTNLYNYTMPFIRYSMGDRGIMLDSEKCSCGFNGPVMKLTEGRDENFIILPDGKEISPRLMFDIINTSFPQNDPGWNMIDFIKTFQIVQESDNLIIVKIVPGPAYSEKKWIEEAKKKLSSLHPEMELQVELVDDLTPAAGKKFHQVLGKLSSRWKKERIKSGM